MAARAPASAVSITGRVAAGVAADRVGDALAMQEGDCDVQRVCGRPLGGGSRDSGFGREHDEMAIENFTEPKAVWINTAA